MNTQSKQSLTHLAQVELDAAHVELEKALRIHDAEAVSRAREWIAQVQKAVASIWNLFVKVQS